MGAGFESAQTDCNYVNLRRRVIPVCERHFLEQLWSKLTVALRAHRHPHAPVLSGPAWQFKKRSKEPGDADVNYHLPAADLNALAGEDASTVRAR